MSCGCECDPCTCPGPLTGEGCGEDVCFIDPCEPVNKDANCSTKCNLDRRDNIWFVPDQPGFDCKCKLDGMTYGQVISVLERVPYAAKQLVAITDDPCLLLLARTVKIIVPEQEEDQRMQDRLQKNSLPYYNEFAGNMGGDVRGARTSSRIRSS
jgi:hypothetical protein